MANTTGVCECGQDMLESICQRSMAPCNEDALKKNRKTPFAFSDGVCPTCISGTITQGLNDAQAYNTVDSMDATFEERGAMGKFAGKCYADKARKEVAYTVETIRQLYSVKLADDWKESVYLCAGCEDHFKGGSVDIDHYDVEFCHILTAFLDSYMPDWLIPPREGTFKRKQNPFHWGWKSKIQKGSKEDYVETEAAYWQRVKNASLRRWEGECMGEKFVMFHNCIVKLQVLCKDCHVMKTTKSASSLKLEKPIYDESIGSSAKRTADIEADNAQTQEEDKFFQSADIEGMLALLRHSIASMDAFTIQNALSTIPKEWMEILPLVQTAKHALDDIRAIENGVLRFPLPPLRRDTYFSEQRIREVSITRKRAREHSF